MSTHAADARIAGPEDPSGEPVTIVALDDHFADRDVPTFIKLDIEGSEPRCPSRRHRGSSRLDGRRWRSPRDFQATCGPSRCCSLILPRRAGSSLGTTPGRSTTRSAMRSLKRPGPRFLMDLRDQLAAHSAAVDGMVQASSDVIIDIAERLIVCFRAGGKVLICGNGGSFADAQHFAAEFVNRFRANRSPWPAISLVTDTSVLTSIANNTDSPRSLRARSRRWDGPATSSSSCRPAARRRTSLRLYERAGSRPACDRLHRSGRRRAPRGSLRRRAIGAVGRSGADPGGEPVRLLDPRRIVRRHR